MGHNSNIKILRGQMRQIVKEMLPPVLTTELQIAIANKLTAQLVDIKAGMTKQLNEMEERQKDALSFLVRRATIDTPAANT